MLLLLMHVVIWHKIKLISAQGARYEEDQQINPNNRDAEMYPDFAYTVLNVSEIYDIIFIV